MIKAMITFPALEVTLGTTDPKIAATQAREIGGGNFDKFLSLLALDEHLKDDLRSGTRIEIEETSRATESEPGETIPAIKFVDGLAGGASQVQLKLDMALLALASTDPLERRNATRHVIEAREALQLTLRRTSQFSMH
jgi:hypothetical protein